MLAAAALDPLRRALGGGELREHAACLVDGAALRHTLVPARAEALPGLLRALAATQSAALLRGGGNRLDYGNAPARADCLLSLEAIRGIEELDAEDGVCRARAGTPLSELRAAAQAAGWELPLDAPGAGATLGGVLAAAECGPRAQGYGRPRDSVLGLDVVLGSGEATRCGGRVVKNVTGYDLAKLYTGSIGALCVIAAAWLRLRARPECVRVLAGELDSARAAVAAARRGSCRAALLELARAAPGSRPRRIALELAGPERAVERDARELEQELGLREAEPELLDRLGRRASAAPLRVRIPVLAGQLDAAERALAAAGGESVAWPGLGFAIAEWQTGCETPAELDALARCCAELARASRGSAVILRAPVAWKRARDVFDLPAGELALTRALKQRFDPAGVLAPGRLPGRA